MSNPPPAPPHPPDLPPYYSSGFMVGHVDGMFFLASSRTRRLYSSLLDLPSPGQNVHQKPRRREGGGGGLCVWGNTSTRKYGGGKGGGGSSYRARP